MASPDGSNPDGSSPDGRTAPGDGAAVGGALSLVSLDGAAAAGEPDPALAPHAARTSANGIRSAPARLAGRMMGIDESPEMAGRVAGAPMMTARARTTQAKALQRSAVEPDALPGEPLSRRIPGEEDQHLERDSQTRWRDSRPWPRVRARQRRHLERALRPDDDLGQCERIVGKRPEQLLVEGPSSIPALPALAGRDDLIDAVLGERRDEPVDVTRVLGDGVTDPQSLDAPQLGRVEPPGQPASDRRPFAHDPDAIRSSDSRVRSTSAAVL